MQNEETGSSATVANEPAVKKAAVKKAVKKAPAKPAKKTAPIKKALKAVAKAVVEILRAANMAEAIKLIKKAERPRGVIVVGGKKWSYSRGSTWAINKSLIDQAEAGLIMVVEEEGHYVYPKKNFSELFKKIFASGTYKNIGTYSQSTLPQWHSDYFTALK